MAFNHKNLKIHSLPSFRLGMNTQQSPDEISDFELADCENFSAEEDSIITAPGYSGWDDDLANHVGPYWGGFMFKKSDGTMVDIRQRQGKLEYSDDGMETWVECTLPTAGSPAEAIVLTEIPCTFAALNDTVVWTNGTDSVMSSTDGITWTIPTYGSPAQELPKSKVVFNNGKNRLLFLGQTDNYFRFDWSGINDPLTIGASSFQLVDPNSNGMVIGAGKTPDGTTLIFKESALYTVSDFVDDGIIDINFVGYTNLSSHQTIATTNNSVIWYSWDGISEYIGGTIRTISGRILVSNSTSIGARNDVLKGELYCAAYYNNKYHLSMPDLNVSEDYNSQEYILYKNSYRKDAMQPYVITRNRRYFGCYWIEDAVFDYGRDITLYVGDSRPESALATSGSPAVREDPIFAWINDYRETTATGFDIVPGLNGASQPAFFTTKYFTQDVPFFVKRFKKVFTNFKVTQNITITLSYRFLPYGAWVDVEETMTADELEWEYDNGETGVFAEGYGFALDTLGNLFVDIENSEKPRGIQFKISCNQIYDVQLYGMGYNYKVKPKFKG